MKLKRIVALVLSLIISLSAFTGVTAYAQDKKFSPDNFFSGIVDTASIVSGKSASQDKAVARVYLVSTKLIHLFIYIQNISDKTIKIGLMDCKPGEGVSLGTFGLTRSDGWGLYYNIESYCLTDYEHYDTRRCEIDAARLEKVNNRIINYNHWDFVVNCAFFACAIWNTASGGFIMPFTISPITKLIIMAGSDGKLPQMSKPDRKNVCKQRGNGSNAYLEVCSDDSIHD